MNKTVIIILTILTALLVGINIGIYYYSHYHTVDVREIEMSIIVMEGIGIDTNNTALTFGGVNPLGTSSRDLLITQELNEKVKVKINLTGEFADWVSISENNFILKRGETKKVAFVAKVPQNVEHRKYTGKAVIVFQNVLF